MSSAFSRTAAERPRTLETLQKQNVYCWFNKQNIWVKDKNDIGTQIMIQVLAVLSQYEIELFTARSIDGKITALKTRGISPLMSQTRQIPNRHIREQTGTSLPNLRWNYRN